MLERNSLLIPILTDQNQVFQPSLLNGLYNLCKSTFWKVHSKWRSIWKSANGFLCHAVPAKWWRTLAIQLFPSVRNKFETNYNTNGVFGDLRNSPLHIRETFFHRLDFTSSHSRIYCVLKSQDIAVKFLSHQKKNFAQDK